MSVYDFAEGRRIVDHDRYIDLAAWDLDGYEPPQDPKDSEEYWESMGAFDGFED